MPNDRPLQSGRLLGTNSFGVEWMLKRVQHDALGGARQVYVKG